MNLRKVFIIGGPASGKTTLSQAVAETLDVPVYELDALLLDGHERGEPFDVVSDDVRVSSPWRLVLAHGRPKYIALRATEAETRSGSRAVAVQVNTGESPMTRRAPVDTLRANRRCASAHEEPVEHTLRISSNQEAGDAR